MMVGMDERIVEKELTRCFDLISKRVQTILLLNQVDQRKVIPATLVLNDLDDHRKALSTFSQATHNQI